ncbi:PPA1309 family protein [uncultured Friedmanniella sp.]|uniref:PPA1309 family protein n=1 Tax=uncultured Friedmanniella sp. TaxID=335381 RepID=UPI0035CA9545
MAGPREPAVPAPEQQEALLAALVELERYVGGAGWDQPPRLFALVLTDVFAAAEPALAAELGMRTTAQGAAPGALTAVEQEEFAPTGDLLGDLAGLEWPDSVFGCALSAERTFLPAGREGELPDDPAAAAAYVAAHPARQDIRVVVGADRAGHVHGVARLVSAPEELLGAADLVPGLGTALAHTLV